MQVGRVTRDRLYIFGRDVEIPARVFEGNCPYCGEPIEYRETAEMLKSIIERGSKKLEGE